MQSTTLSTSPSKKQLLAGRIITTLVILFLLFDGFIKLFNPAPVIQAQVQLGLPPNLTFGIGIVLLICTAIYATPRTAILGALLLTGYLGGAVAIQLRVGNPIFSHVLFPVYFAVLLWAGLLLRDTRLRTLLPVRSELNR
jgi:hypothetical protein